MRYAYKYFIREQNIVVENHICIKDPLRGVGEKKTKHITYHSYSKGS